MTRSEFLEIAGQCPLVVSVQPHVDPSVDRAQLINELARLSLAEGVKILRLEGAESVKTFAHYVPTIGLIKKIYPGSEVYVTPTRVEVAALIQTECAVIALDGTPRERPNGETLAELITAIHAAGKLVMSDCDSIESARYAASCGADLLGTTLSGHTQETQAMATPAIDLIYPFSQIGRPVIAEGGYGAKSQIECAFKAGASAVVVGTAINDVALLTRQLRPYPRLAIEQPTAKIGAVDIGGTWLRFGVFDPRGDLVSEDKVPNPHRQAKCIEWIKDQVQRHQVVKVGVSTGGVVDPATGEVWTAKENLMPDHIGIRFTKESVGVPCVAWGDGHAAAWAHACLPAYSGKRVASIALGTGVGFGMVMDDKIWSGPRGEYPRLNDQFAQGGASYEDLLGGIHLTKTPTDAQMNQARVALGSAVKLVRDLFFPDVVILSGGVGCQPWLKEKALALGVEISPFADTAGLHGAAALALYPPDHP